MLAIVRRGGGVLIGVLVVLSLSVAGCSKNKPAEGRVMPKGRILDNGLPVKLKTENLPPGDPGMKVTFIKIGSADAGDETDAQILDANNGSFELIGADGKGIPPGKYRVAVFLAPEGGTDFFKGKYSRENSKIEIEIKEGQDVVIDLADYK